MPHILIKHFDATLTQQQQDMLSEEISQAVVKAFGCSPHAVSLALRPINPEEWDAKVFQPDIEAHSNELIRSPNYSAI